MGTPKKDNDPGSRRISRSSYGAVVRDEATPFGAPLSTDVFQLGITYTHKTVGEMMNVLHFQPVTAPSEDILTVLKDLVASFVDAVQDILLPMLANDINLSAYTSRRVTGGSPIYTSQPFLAGSGPDLVNDTAMALNIGFIPTAAPWTYGHFYVPGIPDTWMTGNVFDPIYEAKGDSLAAALVTDMPSPVGGISNNWRLCIFERSKTTPGTGTPRAVGGWSREARPTCLKRRIRPWNLATV